MIIFFHSFSSFLSSPVWIIGYQSRNQYVSFLLFLSCSTSVTCSASIYWKYNILLNQWRLCFNYVYLFNIPDWDPTVTWVIIRFKSCSGYGQRVNMIWKRLIGVQIYILDGAYDWAWDSILLSCLVGKRCLLCAGFTDPPKPSGWYRKYIGNRTIEGMSANQKILTSLYLIKLTGQYWFYNWFVRSCDFEGRNLNLNITLAATQSFNWTYWSKLKETAFWLSMLAFPDSLISDVYINSLTNSSLFWRGK